MTVVFQGGQSMPAKRGTPFLKGNVPWNKGLAINNTEMFWSQVMKTNSCWNWTGGVRSKRHPYGTFNINGKRWLAHRYSYFLSTGKTPKTLDHLCRNILCVNPKHLECVSSRVNTQRGNSAKLSSNSISVIRQLYEIGRNQPYIASLFGVGQWQISRII